MKKRTLVLRTITLWRIKWQWWLHWILISWYLQYMYLYLSSRSWLVFTTKKKHFVNVSKIHDYIVNAVAVTLPGMFVLTCCDTMIYLYRKSKKAILKRVLRQEIIDVKLLSDFGEHTYLSETSEEKLKRFVHIFFNGMYRKRYVLIYVLIFYLWLFRSSHQGCKNCVLKNFVIFTRKHLCWSLILRKLHTWRSATFLKKEPNTGVFLWILRNS